MDESPDPTFAERLEYWRSKAGISQRAIAQALDIDDSSVTSWAKGRSKPTLDNFSKLCRVLGIDEHTFWGPLAEETAEAVG